MFNERILSMLDGSASRTVLKEEDSDQQRKKK